MFLLILKRVSFRHAGMPARLESVIVEIRGLTKVYAEKQRVVAVDGIDLSVEQGEIFGLLGPNGAGKTTTISIATTRALPTRGQVTIAGWMWSRSRQPRGAT